jgi:hypothetical protein
MPSSTTSLRYGNGRRPESPDLMVSPTPAKSSSMPFLSSSRPSPSSFSSLLVTPKTKLGSKVGGFLTLSADAMTRAKNRKEQKLQTLKDKQRRRSNIMDAVDDIGLVSSTSGSDLHDIGETADETDLNTSLESKRTSTGRTSPSSRSNTQRYGRRGSCTAYTVETTNGEEYQPSSFRNLLDQPGSKKNKSKSKQKQSQAEVPPRRSKKSALQSPATTLPLTIDDRPIPLKKPRPASVSSLPTAMPLGGGGGHNNDDDGDEGSVVTPTAEPRYQRRGAATKYSGSFQEGGGGYSSSTKSITRNKPRMS